MKVDANLEKTITRLISMGVTDFISGGEPGFDMMAAEKVLKKKAEGYPVRLIFVFTCKGHDNRWSKKQRDYCHPIFDSADEIVYASEESTLNCATLQSQLMLRRSSYCVCALMRKNTGMSGIVRSALQSGLKILCASAD